jgi:two-component system chemotaxis response regulator CheY
LKTLIVEDDFTSRVILQRLLAPFGESHIAVSGGEALRAFEAAWAQGAPYALLCLDVTLSPGEPGGVVLDGRELLRRVRSFEQSVKATSAQAARVIMTTIDSDAKSIVSAFSDSCDGYLVKPVDVARLRDLLHEFGMSPRLAAVG